MYTGGRGYMDSVENDIMDIKYITDIHASKSTRGYPLTL